MLRAIPTFKWKSGSVSVWYIGGATVGELEVNLSGIGGTTGGELEVNLSGIEKYDKKTKETRPSVLGMTTNEGKTWKDFKRTIDTVRGKKQEMPKPKKADDAGARARRLMKRKEHQSKVSVIVPPELED